MVHSAVFIRLTLQWEDVLAAAEYLEELDRSLKGSEGYLGGTSWSGFENPHERLVLLSFESEASAKRGFAQTAEVRSLIERQEAGATPSDVLVAEVARAEGDLERGVPEGELLSMSVRQAAPGYGTEMIEEYEDVFAGLTSLPGYGGMLIAASARSSDEIVGLVSWESEAPYRASMPSRPLYDVVLYERSRPQPQI